MVYIRDGKVLKERPFSLRTITDFFWGIILFVIYLTLVGLEGRGNSSNGGSRPGGRGNGPGGGPGGGPRGPKTIGRITTIQDCSMPGGG